MTTQPSIVVEAYGNCSLRVVVVDGKPRAAFVGRDSHPSALAEARKLEREAYDAEDARRRELGRPKASRPNVDIFEVHYV